MRTDDAARMLESGDAAGALALCDDDLRQDPDRFDALLIRGQARHRLGDNVGALDDLQRAADLEPDDPIARLHRGHARFALERWEDAIADYDIALASRTDLPWAWVNRGSARVEVGREQEAMTDFAQAIAADPTWHLPFRERGRARRRRGELEQAIADYDRALELEPTDLIAVRWRAFAKLDAGDPAGAAADYERFLRERPDESAEPWYNLGTARLRAGLPRDAADAFTRYIAKAPNDPDGYARRAKARTEAGELVEAYEDLTRAMDLGATGDVFADADELERRLGVVRSAGASARYLHGTPGPEYPNRCSCCGAAATHVWNATNERYSHGSSPMKVFKVITQKIPSCEACVEHMEPALWSNGKLVWDALKLFVWVCLATAPPVGIVHVLLGITPNVATILGIGLIVPLLAVAWSVRKSLEKRLTQRALPEGHWRGGCRVQIVDWSFLGDQAQSMTLLVRGDTYARELLHLNPELKEIIPDADGVLRPGRRSQAN